MKIITLLFIISILFPRMVYANPEGYDYGEGTYVDEIQGFIQAIKKEKKFPYSFKEDLYMLNLLETIEAARVESVSP